MKKVLHKNGWIIDWQDHEAFGYAEPGDDFGLLDVSQTQWEARDTYKSVQDGELSAMQPPPLAVLGAEDILELVKTELRPLRNRILADVVQIALVAKALGDEALAAEVLTPETGARDRLRDITDDPALNSAATREEMEAAVLAYYDAIVAKVSPELRGAFNELEK